MSDNPADSLRRELTGWCCFQCGHDAVRHHDGGCKVQFPDDDSWRDCACSRDFGAALEAARADEPTKTALRALHWVTAYADGPFKGLPCCGCCSWMDGIRKPWPCDTLQVVGFTDADIPAEFGAVSDGG